MDWSAHKYPWLSLLVGFALVFLWGLMSLTHAYDRNLAAVSDSFTLGFMTVDQLGATLDALARLSVDQEAFLSSGDERFQDGVISGTETLELDVSTLNSLADRSEVQGPLLAGLCRSIEQLLVAVGESDGIKQARGRAAALAFFQSREAAISIAQSQADRLKREIAGGLSHRIRSARGAGALFQDLLYGGVIGSGHGAPWSNSAGPPGRAAAAGAHS